MLSGAVIGAGNALASSLVLRALFLVQKKITMPIITTETAPMLAAMTTGIIGNEALVLRSMGLLFSAAIGITAIVAVVPEDVSCVDSAVVSPSLPLSYLE